MESDTAFKNKKKRTHTGKKPVKCEVCDYFHSLMILISTKGLTMAHMMSQTVKSSGVRQNKILKVIIGDEKVKHFSLTKTVYILYQSWKSFRSQKLPVDVNHNVIATTDRLHAR